jgi:malate dehydrogenase
MGHKKTVSIIGSGNVGEHIASLLVLKGAVNIRLFDLPKKDGEKLYAHVKGKALDMLQMACALGVDADIKGFVVDQEGNGYEAMEGSDIVVITAGFPRKPGMSRDDLLSINISIMNSISKKIKQYAPKAVVIVVTNPVDIMTYAVYRLLGFDKKRVIGMAGVLDSSRFRTFISLELNVSPKDVHAYVIGGHGDEMVPLVNVSNVGGIPISTLIEEKKLKELVERTRFGGGEIVDYMGTSAYHAPAASVVEMIESVALNAKRVLTCSVLLDEEASQYYGAKGLCVGVPVKLGEDGVEKIVKVPMTDYEKGLWEKSVASVRKNIAITDDFISKYI